MVLTTEIQERILHNLEADAVAVEVQARVAQLYVQLAAVLDDAHRQLLDELVDALGQYRDRVEHHAYVAGVTEGAATATGLQAMLAGLRALALRLEHAVSRLEGGRL